MPAYTSQRVDLPCAETAFVEAGEGFPLVLVHGLLGYSFSWRKNISALAEHFRVLAIDLAGCGHSGPLTVGQYGVETWSRQLEEFLDALGLAKTHIVATSAGGAVALDLASRRGDRVEKMVLVAPVNPFSRRVNFLARAYTATGMPTPVLRMILARAPQWLPWFFRHRYYYDASRLTPETVPGYLAGLRPELTIPMLRQSIAGWKPAASRERLWEIKAPVLLMWGEHDTLVPASSMPQLAKALPNATTLVFRDAGHFCYEEIPALFNQRVLRFLGEPRQAP